MIARAFDPNACGYSIYDSNGKWLEGVYTRVHRDPQIINSMRSWMKMSSLNDFSSIGLNPHCMNHKENFQFLKFIEN